MRRSPSLSLLVLFGAGLTACGARPTPPPPDLPPPPSVPALPAAGAFYTAGLSEYGAAAGLPPSPLEQRLRAVVKSPAPPPPALECAAREHAARFAADAADPDPTTGQWLAWHCGLWMPPRDTYAVTGPSAVAVEDNLRRLALDATDTVFAVGAVTHPDGKVTAAVLGLPGDVRLSPFPRTLPAAEQLAPLEGRAGRGEGDLGLLFDAPGGEVVETGVDADPTGSFSTRVPLPPAASGPFHVEVLRREGRFLRSVALLRLDAIPATAYPPPPRAVPLSARSDTGRTLAAAVNRVRIAAGRGPLRPVPDFDVRLDEWLHRAASGPVEAVPPGLADEAGRPFSRVRFSFSAGRNADQAVDLLASTPLGKLALLARDDDRVAFGVRAFPRAPGFDALIVTLRGFSAVAPDVARAQLRTLLAAARQGQGLAEVRPAAGLDAAAQAVAEAVVAGTVPWTSVLEAAGERVRAGKLASGAFGGGAFTVSAPAEARFATENAALSPDVRYVGIGVASGALPGDPTPRHVIVYLVAEKIPDGA